MANKDEFMFVLVNDTPISVHSTLTEAIKASGYPTREWRSAYNSTHGFSQWRLAFPPPYDYIERMMIYKVPDPVARE